MESSAQHPTDDQSAPVQLRLTAFLIDLLIVGALFFAISALEIWGMNQTGNHGLASTIVGMALLLRFALSFYFVYFYFGAGQTVGMRFMRLRIISEENSNRPEITQAILRDLPNLIFFWVAILASVLTFNLILRYHDWNGPLVVTEIPGYKELREGFFDILLGAAAVISINSLPILVPRIRRSLSDLCAGTSIVRLDG
jgi:uncharacterized RDD family membrane protein YckC